MATTIHDVLDELRSSASSEADKGSKFERLVKAYLTKDPVFADQFAAVWLWSEWPGNGGKRDTGVDLVALDRVTGRNVAIQCKFYAPTSTVGKPEIDSFLSASGSAGFAERVIVSTTDRWNRHAEETISDQDKPVRRIGMAELAASNVDWGRYSLASPEVMYLGHRKQPRPHQRAAIDAVRDGFMKADRGKLVMACGTGKTFTSLRLAEELVGAGGSVLLLVPSISLLSQTVREWVGEAEVPLEPLAVCSDPKSTQRANRDAEDISTVDLALPATTDVARLVSRLDAAAADRDAMTVVFGTYQSIDVVARAQQTRGGRFDLIICDEAHRTTGTTLADQPESAFVRVHDDAYLPGAKRLYMTATPRIYEDSSKAKAGEADAVLCSMDDETLYGPELHRLSFGEAVQRDLLTDYKVLVLVVDETAVARTFQQQLSGSELQLDDAAKIVGCWNGLAKRGLLEHGFEPDAAPMRRAVAFAGTIADSKRIEDLFTEISGHYASSQGLDDDGRPPLTCHVQHVDGTFNALQRNGRLDWLKAEPAQGSCRILTNARCLSEGVDVPALDAVMFLSPRKSVVDIVQSVGRVMRKADGKDFGYIVLPVGIPAGVAPEVALRDNKRYAAVWEVLQALRAHDERFDATVNRISLTRTRDQKINVIGVGGGGTADGDGDAGKVQGELGLVWENLDDLRDAVYSKIVAKVGTRTYWSDWASSVADIAVRQTTRITALLADPATSVAHEFDTFLYGLRGNLNEGISATDAVEMLAQHLITRPVFNALFEGYDVLSHNPVAQTMERMLTALDEHHVDDENHTLEKFYASVRMRVRGIDSAEGRQRIILELYNTFFAKAFKRTVDKLGVVYTPVEIVDFILRSADEVLRSEFGHGITDEGVHVLDGFVGTGTFITRLLSSGLIRPEDLARKYASELHANEILLLAYYIAAVNIETTYQDVTTGHVAGHVDGQQSYEPFPGLVLTDTFQSWEDDDRPDLAVFPENNDRLQRLKQLPITVIVGNPPYSSGQESANDNNANESYPSLDLAIRESYVRRSSAGLSRNMYDSYVRAFRWASLRLGDRGVVAFVTNGSFLESKNADGMRKVLSEEFTTIHILNLRGNTRHSGERVRKEGGKLFDSGSRATVAVTLLVKGGAEKGSGRIQYTDIGDYLTRQQKLAKIAGFDEIATLPEAVTITPDQHGDWLGQRSEDLATFLPLSSKGDPSSVFAKTGPGLLSNRDAWVYGFGRRAVGVAVRTLAETYARDRERLAPSYLGSLDDRGVARLVTNDASAIAWTRGLRGSLRRGTDLRFSAHEYRSAMYRPFQRSVLYADRALIEVPSRMPERFPAGQAQYGIYVSGPGSSADFAALIVRDIPDLHLLSTGHLMERWSFARVDEGALAIGDVVAVDGYRKVDNITDEALRRFRGAYGEDFTKDDVFSYVYGLLHSPEYRNNYAADLKKMLPRIPLVEAARPLVEAGRSLAHLHLDYEEQAPYPLEGLDAAGPGGDADYDFFRVQKMRFGKPTPEQKAAGQRSDKGTVLYNSHITLRGVPEAAHRYTLGSRSAVEWVIDRYQVKQDKASGIVNDPNDWSREVGDPRYVIDLLARIVTVSVETMKIVDALPPLDIRPDQGSGSA